MVDFAMDVHKNLYPDQEIPNSLIEKRKSVVEKLKGLQENMEKIQKIFEDEEVGKMIQNARDGRVLFESLQKSHDFQPEMVDKLYEYAKFRFECGNYTAASEYLYFCRVLLPPSSKNYLPALWGKLASEILMQNWESALDDLNRLKEIIDTGAFSPLQSLQQRTWLIHWALFVFFNQCISIKMLAEKLNMKPEEAERWIVNLIRNARLDAKIDSKAGHVVMGTQAVSPYQQVIEKTKGLAFRSQMLIVKIEKTLGSRVNEGIQWGADM